MKNKLIKVFLTLVLIISTAVPAFAASEVKATGVLKESDLVNKTTPTLISVTVNGTNGYETAAPTEGYVYWNPAGSPKEDTLTKTYRGLPSGSHVVRFNTFDDAEKATITVDYGVIGTLGNKNVIMTMTISNINPRLSFMASLKGLVGEMTYNESGEAYIVNNEYGWQERKAYISVGDLYTEGFLLHNITSAAVKYDVSYEDGTPIKNVGQTLASLSTDKADIIAGTKISQSYEIPDWPIWYSGSGSITSGGQEFILRPRMYNWAEGNFDDPSLDDIPDGWGRVWGNANNSNAYMGLSIRNIPTREAVKVNSPFFDTAYVKEGDSEITETQDLYSIRLTYRERNGNWLPYVDYQKIGDANSGWFTSTYSQNHDASQVHEANFDYKAFSVLYEDSTNMEATFASTGNSFWTPGIILAWDDPTVEIDKTVDGVKEKDVKVGDEVEYKVVIDIDNLKVPTIDVTDEIPAGVSLIENTVSAKQGIIDNVDFTVENGVITVKAPNGKTTLTFKAKVTDVGEITNTAKVPDFKDENDKPVESSAKINSVMPKGKVTVHYVDEDGNPLADDIEMTDEVGKSYSTDQKEFEGYVFKEVTGAPVVGTYKEEDQEVTYVYSKLGKLVVKHVDENGNDLKDPVTTEEKVGTPYQTNEETFPGYRIKTVPSNKDGSYTDGTTTVTYVYEPIPEPSQPEITKEVSKAKLDSIDEVHTYTIKSEMPENAKAFVITDGLDECLSFEGDPTVKVGGQNVGTATKSGQKLTVSFTEAEIEANAGKEVIVTFDAKISVNDEDLVQEHSDRKVPNKASYEITSLKDEKKDPVESNEVKVEAPTPKGTLIVKYQTEDGTPLEDPAETTEDVGTPYETTQKTFEGYEFVEVQGSPTGEYTDGTTEVIYVYKPIPKKGTLVVKHVDEEGNDLAEPVTTEENVGTPYETSEQEFDGYRIKTVPANKDGEYSEGTTEVVYVYEKIPPKTGTLIVKHQTTDGTDLCDPAETTENVGTPYETSEKEFEGYRLVETPTNANGEYVEGTTTVTYIYEPIPEPEPVKGTLVVRHVDEDGNPLAEDATTTEDIGTPYETEKMSFDDYDFKEVQGDEKGEYKEGTTIVTYVYAKKPSNLTVNYVTEDGKALHDPLKSDGKIGDPYETTPMDFEDYELVKVEGDEKGTLPEGGAVVTYIYKPIPKPTPVLEKSVSKESVSVGGTVTYTIKASSDIPLKNAVITDVAPHELEIIADSLKVEGSKLTNTSAKSWTTPTEKGSTTSIFEFEELTEATITYQAKVLDEGEHVNVAALTADNFPKGPLEDDAKVTAIIPKAILQKTVSEDEVMVGDEVDYEITAKTAEGTIYDAVIEDTLPSGMKVDADSVDVSVEGAEVEITNAKIIVKLPKLTIDGVVITYTAEATKAGEHVNTVTLTGSNLPEPLEAEALVTAEKEPIFHKGPSKSSSKSGPKTGDATPIALAVIAFGAAALATGTIVYKRKKKGTE